MGVCSVRPDQLAHVLLSGAALLRGCRPRYHRGTPRHATLRHAMPCPPWDPTALHAVVPRGSSAGRRRLLVPHPSAAVIVPRLAPSVQYGTHAPANVLCSVGISAAGCTQRTADVVSDERIGAHRGGPVCGVAHRRAAVRLIGGYGAAAHSLHDCARNQPSVREPNGFPVPSFECLFVCVFVRSCRRWLCKPSTSYVSIRSASASTSTCTHIPRSNPGAPRAIHAAVHRNPTGLSDELVNGLSWLAIAYAVPSVGPAQRSFGRTTSGGGNAAAVR